jgi:hypothetical protein
LRFFLLLSRAGLLRLRACLLRLRTCLLRWPLLWGRLGVLLWPLLRCSLGSALRRRCSLPALWRRRPAFLLFRLPFVLPIDRYQGSESKEERCRSSYLKQFHLSDLLVIALYRQFDSQLDCRAQRLISARQSQRGALQIDHTRSHDIGLPSSRTVAYPVANPAAAPFHYLSEVTLFPSRRPLACLLASRNKEP